jgi:hypothetical protein
VRALKKKHHLSKEGPHHLRKEFIVENRSARTLYDGPAQMDQKHALLHHFLAALAYRTQKALRGAPAEFASFRAGLKVRTPHELIRHMDDVLGYSRTFFIGGSYRSPEFRDFRGAVVHFHETLADVAWHIELGTKLRDVTPEVLLQGPFSDAMTHAGQLALLRRLAGSPVPPENFVFADIQSANLGPDQPLPARPDKIWLEGPEE